MSQLDITQRATLAALKAAVEVLEKSLQTTVPQATELLMPPVAAPVKKNQRMFVKLYQAMEVGETVSIRSGGDKWIGTFTKDGFSVGGITYTSPYAFGKAHAQRITEKHPAPTKPGNGWEWVMVESGPHAGKSIGQVYDAHFA